ncbi:rho GTPase-activating protein 12-like isoform X2 [Sipha flava]|nr:rho GTPase-activating protein 12-like isoform X2 [Sipha flava]XP_025417932.1 rho GTPase-activating protein 12-like isoform X2 [Sipha flava]
MDIADIKVRVLYDFEYKTRENKHISIKEGEKLLLLKKTNDDWWQVIRSSGRPFYVPATFVKEIPRAPSRPSLSKGEEKIKMEKPQVLKRTIFEKPSTPSYENIPLENTTVVSVSDSIIDSVISDIKRVDIQNENNILSPVANRKNKTVVTVNQENTGYCQVNVKKCSTKEQVSLQLSSSLEELAQEIELKSMPLNKNTTNECSPITSYSKVQNLLENIRKPSNITVKNAIDVEKPDISSNGQINKNVLCYSGSFKTKHERDKWAKNIMSNGNIIEENKLDDEESMMMSDSIVSKSTSTPDAHSTSADLTGGSTDSLLDGDSLGITDSDQDSLRMHGSRKRTSLARNRRVDSYSKRYPLRSTSPPIPDGTLNHGEYLFGSWYKYSIEDGNKVFYYNTKTCERTWSSPKQRENKISRPSSAGTINSGSQSSSPLAELDEELYEPNDNTPSLKTKVKLISETPVGWIMKADPNSGLPCFVNQSTGAKWFTSKDFEGRSYYFEENSNESSWTLPETNNKILRNTSPSNSKVDLEDSSSSLKPSNKNIIEKNDSPILKSSLSPQVPRNWPQLWDGHMCVLKEGPLNRTKMTENGKRLRKNWTTSHVILTELFLLFFKDAKSFIAMKNGNGRPELCIDLNGALVQKADKMSSRKNVYVISTVLRTQVLFQNDCNIQAESWLYGIQAAISNLPCSYDSCPRIPSSNILELPEDEKITKVNRNKSINIKLKDGGSMEDLTATNVERQTKIKARLRKFFHRRPTIELLVKKGIWKDEPAFGCFLEHVTGTNQPRIPEFVKRCITAIESSEDNLKTDGLYRASGNLSQVQKIRLQVDQNNLSVIDQEEDVHVLTGVLKLFFRELKEPLIPYHAFRKAISAGTSHSHKDKLSNFCDITKSLPGPNYDTLKFLLKHLLKVTSYKEFNRMHIPNLAIVFGPTLMWPEIESTNMAIDLMQQNMVIEALLVDFDNIFK